MKYKVERYEGKVTERELRQNIKRENSQGWRCPGVIHSALTDYIYVVFEQGPMDSDTYRAAAPTVTP